MISVTDVHCSGALSSLTRPVNLGNLMPRPAPSLRTSLAAVWMGLSVISAATTSRTTAGSNQTSGTISASTDDGFDSESEPSSRAGMASRNASSNPVPSLQTVSNLPVSPSYAAISSAPYLPALLPMP